MAPKYHKGTQSFRAIQIKKGPPLLRATAVCGFTFCQEPICLSNRCPLLGSASCIFS